MVVRSVLLAGLIFAAAQAAAGVDLVPYAELEGELTSKIDFESYAKVPSPGEVLDGIVVLDGAAFGERFAGQVLAQDGPFDALHLTPRGPLALEAGIPGQNLAVEFVFFMSNQLKGMAPPGFPEREAGGEGAVSILFDRDQSALGFRVTSEPKPQDASIPKGRMTVAFYARSGALIDELDVELEWVLAGYGFRRVGGAEDIAGVTITNRDPQGVAIDDVIFDRDLVLGLLALPE